MQHFTKNTVSVSLFCKRCRKSTPHRVWEGRVDPSHCMECFPEDGKLKTIKQPEIVEVLPGAIYYREVERPLVTVEIPAACTCSRYAGGHYHHVTLYGAELERFVPGTWEERAA